MGHLVSFHVSISTAHTTAPSVPTTLSPPGPLLLENGKERAEKLWQKAQFKRGGSEMGFPACPFLPRYQWTPEWEACMAHFNLSVAESSRLRGNSFQRNL